MNTSLAPPVLAHLGTLGDVTRCRLLAVLDRREFSVSELCQALQLPQPTVSRHLKVLADDGWVRARSEGTRRPYRRIEQLPPEQGRLWEVVREDVARDPRVLEDRERADAVLARRQDRSTEFFAGSADRWDAIRADLYGIRADLLPLFGLLDPRWSVVDLGAGTGVLADTLAPFVASVVLVDRSPEMLERARHRLERHGNVDFREDRIESLSLADASVDLAILSLVLHHVPEPSRALTEAHRILRPGGRALIVDMREHERADMTDEMGHQWPGFDPGSLRAWLTGAGFEPGPWTPLPPDPDAQGPLLFLQTARKPTG